MNEEIKPEKTSIFAKWFLNSKFSIALLNILLTFLVLFVFNKISFVFDPITAFVGAILPAVIFAAVQYYLMNPLVDLFENKFKIKRTITIALLFILVTALVILIIVTLIPIIQDQVNAIIKNWPVYWKSARNSVNDLLKDPRLNEIENTVQNYSDQIQKSLMGSVNDTLSDTVNHLSSAVNLITVIFMTVLTAPVILFYMLRDGRQLKEKISSYFPSKYRSNISNLLTEINTSVASYVRGQLIVAFWVGVMFSVGYGIVGQTYGLTLGIVAAVLNLIPYFGTFVAIIPSLIIAMFDSTGMLIKVIIVFMIEQTLESKVVSPLVLGNKMNMHPVTTILVLIGASAVYGLTGVIFAIPVYAILKIIFQRVFDFYKKRSGLYIEEMITTPTSTKNDTPNPPISS